MVSVTTNAIAPSGYCASKATNPTEYINRVKLNSIANTSGAGMGYSDFTSISTDLTSPYFNYAYVYRKWKSSLPSAGYAIWIDFNQDGDFDDSGELVGSRTTTSYYALISFKVPAIALPGATRMRVAIKKGGVSGPCETFADGEVEDYTVNIR